MVQTIALHTYTSIPLRPKISKRIYVLEVLRDTEVFSLREFGDGIESFQVLSYMHDDIVPPH